jgi:mono/diheme cytochrome c family protein
MACREEKTTLRTVEARRGETTFTLYCTACHSSDGRGIRGKAPPLEGSSWVAEHPSRAIRIILHGLKGPIDVGGARHDLEMPPFGPLFSDDRVANVLTYVRERFGGKGVPVEAAEVARIRAATRDRTTRWTAEELRATP